MAVVEPYFYLTCSSTTNWAGYVNYTLTDDPDNNRTKIDAELWAYKVEGSSGGNNPLFAPTITINGITYGGDADKYVTEYKTHTKHLEVNDVYVYHDSNGEKTLTISGKVVKEKDPDDWATTLDGKNIYGSITIPLTHYVTKYTITYNANGGSGTTSSQTVDDGSAVTLRENGFIAPAYPVWNSTLDGNGGNDGSPTFKGNYFHKWRDGSTSGTDYAAGVSYVPKKDTTMYAWWESHYTFGTTTRDSTYDEGYTVTFDANGGFCDTHYLTSVITTSYDFSGWGDKAINPTFIFENTATYVHTSDYTAYAIWSPVTTNGSIALPIPTRNGYEFLGWSIDEYDTSGVIGEYTPNEDVTLYAIWKPTGLVYIKDTQENPPNPYMVLIKDGSGWNQYIPYIKTESGWELYSG